MLNAESAKITRILIPSLTELPRLRLLVLVVRVPRRRRRFGGLAGYFAAPLRGLQHARSWSSTTVPPSRSIQMQTNAPRAAALRFTLHGAARPGRQVHGRKESGCATPSRRGFDFVALVHGNGQPESLPDLIAPRRRGRRTPLLAIADAGQRGGGTPLYSSPPATGILTANARTACCARSLSEFHSRLSPLLDRDAAAAAIHP